MNKSRRCYCVLACCLTIVALAGCFPEDSITWSNDGTVGLFQTNGRLFLVDGTDGTLTPVEAEKEEVQPMPGLSADGNLIAYVTQDDCNSVSEGLALFPPFIVEMLRHDAQQLAQKVLAGVVQAGNLLDTNKSIGFAQPYRQWVVRTMCQNPDTALVEKLGADKLAECRRVELQCDRLIVTRRTEPQKGTTLVTLPMGTFGPRFSPDGCYVAYLVTDRRDDDKGNLYLATTDGKRKAVEVVKSVALRFDWRPDGRAIAYIKQDGDALLGVVEEKILIDDGGTLLSELTSDPDTAPIGIERAAGQARQLVGTLFQPFMNVQYGTGDRLFFSSAGAKIPTSDLEEPTYSLYCYDRLTATVANVLPSSMSQVSTDNVNFFELSPDGTKVLLPGDDHRFAIYTLGEKTAVMPIDEKEATDKSSSAGNDTPKMFPSWKGNTEITCLVSGQSRLLDKAASKATGRDEVIVLNVDGSFHSNLSKDWPDDVIP